MNPVATFFWVLALANLFLSTALQLRVARLQNTKNIKLMKGQRKDDWLGAIIMSFTIICDSTSLTGWLYLKVRELASTTFGDLSSIVGVVYLLSTITIAWLLKRTVQRLALLSGR